MLIDSKTEEAFAESTRSPAIKILGALLAIALTGGVFLGYTYLRNKHNREAAALLAAQTTTPEPKGPPQALVMIDDAMMKGGVTVLGGVVKNTSDQKLGPLTLEIELRRRKDGGTDTKTVALNPAEIGPQEEARYSIELKTQDYGSARVSALKAEGKLQPLPYATAQGRKRALERTETKTITVDKRQPGRGDEFLNSADNPARIP